MAPTYHLQSFQVTIDRVRYLSHPVLTASATKETAKVSNETPSHDM